MRPETLIIPESRPRSPSAMVRCACLGWLAAAMVTLAVNTTGCDAPSTGAGSGSTDRVPLAFEYRRVGDNESILVHGVPDDAESAYSIAGGPATLLPASRSIEIPAGLSGRVMVSVQWSRGSIVVLSGHRDEMIDLDEKRARALPPAAAP
jgi:hypothetical protein